MNAPMYGVGASGTAVLGAVPDTAYHIQLFGDSLADISNGSLDKTKAYTLGQELIGHTCKLGSVTEFAVGGDNLTQIGEDFAANFNAADRTYNTIYLSGGHNDLVDGSTVETMKTQMATMADAVIVSGRHYLIIVNIPPWGDNDSWSTAKQAILEEYNTWLAATYPDYMVDIYTPLNNGTADGKLDPTYWLSAQKSHPINNGCRKADEVVGKKLLYTAAATDLTEPDNNVHPSYRDFTAWNPISAANTDVGTHGGSVLCADGTYSSEKGLVALLTASNQKSVRLNGLSIDDGNTARATFYLRSGNVNFAKLVYRDSDAQLYTIFVDIKTATAGTQVDDAAHTAVWTIEKAAYGWVKAQVTVINDNTTGTGVTQLQIISVSASETLGYTASTADTSAEIFVDAVSLVDLGVV